MSQEKRISEIHSHCQLLRTSIEQINLSTPLDEKLPHLQQLTNAIKVGESYCQKLKTSDEVLERIADTMVEKESLESELLFKEKNLAELGEKLQKNNNDYLKKPYEKKIQQLKKDTQTIKGKINSCEHALAELNKLALLIPTIEEARKLISTLSVQNTQNGFNSETLNFSQHTDKKIIAQLLRTPRARKVKEVNLENISLTEELIKSLTELIGTSSKLTSLNLSNTGLNEALLKIFTDNLKTNNLHLTKLSLSYNNLNAACAKYLVILLEKTQITTFNISFNHLGYEGFSVIARNLPTSLSNLNAEKNDINFEKQPNNHLTWTHLLRLTFLNIKQNSLGNEGIKLFSEAVSKSKEITLSEIKISHVKANQESMALLLDSLKKLTNVTSLELIRVDIDNNNSTKLNTLIPSLSKLQHLTLVTNSAFTPDLEITKIKLRTLCLNCRGLSTLTQEVSIKLFSTILSNNIRKVDLKNSDLSVDGVKGLLHVLSQEQYCSNLSDLGLPYNGDSLKDLTSLSYFTNLITLNLPSLKLTNENITGFAELITKIKKLEFLVISYDQLTDKKIIPQICSAANKLKHLKTLAFHTRNLTTADAERFFEATFSKNPNIVRAILNLQPHNFEMFQHYLNYYNSDFIKQLRLLVNQPNKVSQTSRFKSLIQKMQKNEKLPEKIDLQGIIDDSQLVIFKNQFIAYAIQNEGNITELNLSKNYLAGCGYDISQIIKAAPNLQVLNLDETHLNPADIMLIENTIKSNPNLKLKNLSLEGNQDFLKNKTTTSSSSSKKPLTL